MLFSAPILGFGGGSRAATVAFASSAVDSVDRTIYTFSGVAIGTATLDRKVVVSPVGNIGAGGGAVSTVTVGGISASLVVAIIGGVQSAEIWQADVPTGTTADVVVTWAAEQARSGIGVFAVTGAASGASDTATSTADPMSTTLTIPANGIAIGVGTDNAGGPFAWTNLTERYDEPLEGAIDHTGASDAFITHEVGRTITCDPSGASSSPAMALAAWGAI